MNVQKDSLLWLGRVQAGCMEEVASEVGAKGWIGFKHRNKGRLVSQAREPGRPGPYGKEQSVHDVDLSPGATGLVWEGMGDEGINVLGTLLHVRHQERSSCTSRTNLWRMPVTPVCQARGCEGTVHLGAADWLGQCASLQSNPLQHSMCQTGGVMGPGRGGSQLCVFDSHLRMPLMEQAEQRWKPKLREATNMFRPKNLKLNLLILILGVFPHTTLHCAGRAWSWEFLLLK